MAIGPWVHFVCGCSDRKGNSINSNNVLGCANSLPHLYISRSVATLLFQLTASQLQRRRHIDHNQNYLHHPPQPIDDDIVVSWARPFSTLAISISSYLKA